jgi:hypothetical protein
MKEMISDKPLNARKRVLLELRPELYYYVLEYLEKYLKYQLADCKIEMDLGRDTGIIIYLLKAYI